MIGDLLYQLSLMEERSAPVLQRLSFRVSQTQSAVTVNANSPNIPADKAFLLLSAAALITAGAGQTVSFMTITYLDQQFVNSTRLSIKTPAAPQAVDSIQLSVAPVLLMPNELVSCSATFNAAANPNNVTLDVSGILLPKGNLQLR